MRGLALCSVALLLATACEERDCAVSSEARVSDTATPGGFSALDVVELAGDQTVDFQWEIFEHTTTARVAVGHVGEVVWREQVATTNDLSASGPEDDDSLQCADSLAVELVVTIQTADGALNQAFYVPVEMAEVDAGLALTTEVDVDELYGLWSPSLEQLDGWGEQVLAFDFAWTDEGAQGALYLVGRDRDEDGEIAAMDAVRIATWGA